MHTPPQGFVNDDEPLRRLQARLRKVTTMSAWQERTRLELQELQADLDAARALIGAFQYSAGIDDEDAPPPQLVHAARVNGPEHQPVAVEIDGVEVMLVVGCDRRPDPIREARTWQALVAMFRSVRGQARA